MPNTSEQQAARATTHGAWVGDRRLTAELCRNLQERTWQELELAEKFGVNYEPLICKEWLYDLARMVREIEGFIGLRPSRDFILAPRVEGWEMNDVNVQWIPRPPRVKRRSSRGDVSRE